MENFEQKNWFTWREFILGLVLNVLIIVVSFMVYDCYVVGPILQLIK